MAKAPAKKINTPNWTLKPGQRKKLNIQSVKLKLKKLDDIKMELEKIEKAQRQAGPLGMSPTIFVNPALTAKMAEFHDMLDAEEEKLRKLLAKLTAEYLGKKSSKFNAVAEVIQKECKQALAAYKAAGQVLYRGVGKKNNPSAYIGRSWENRQTLNSDPVMQKVFDMALTKMGIRALRSNSIYCTGEVEDTMSYGDPYVIIPKDGFQFCWNTKTPDLVLDFEYHDSVYKMNIVTKIDQSVEKWVEKHPSSYGYVPGEFTEIFTDEGYFDAIDMLHKVKFPEATIKKITLDALVNINGIKKDIGPTDKDFGVAVKSGHEVMISGEYYAFNLREFKAILEHIIGIQIADAPERHL